MTEQSARRGPSSSLWLHRLAIVTAAATFPLLFIGGLVTSKGAGLAVPDWPTTFGYNMFLYPWAKMIGGIFYEHSHRLVASLVGLLTVLLALWLWLRERRAWMRRLGALALALVIVQGVIGGLRVVLVEETLAIIHGCVAQAFFALTVSLVLFTSREWTEAPRRTERADAGKLQRLAVLTVILIYVQGVFGAVLRYAGAALTLHLLFAALVAIHVVLLCRRLLKFHSSEAKLGRPALLLIGLLVVQLGLGVGSYLGKFTRLGESFSPTLVVLLTTTHVVTGALLLVTSLVVALRAYRLLASPTSILEHGVLSEQPSV